MKILLTDDIEVVAARRLEQNGFAVDSLPTMTSAELSRVIPEYSGIAVRSATRLDAAMLVQAKNLQLIVRGGVGIDNIDVQAATRHGIKVANTPGANTIATAELTLALMLALSRHVVASHNSLVRQEWQRSKFRGVELFGKSLGILGFGRIGREVAKRAITFGMTALAYDPYVPEKTFAETGVRYATLAEVFRDADYLTLHLPLDSSTRAIVGASALAQMKNGVRLINCARGGLLDEAAVARGLENGKVAGVALDVYETEPPSASNPLLGRSGVISVPHLGAHTLEAQAKVAEEVAHVIMDFFINKNCSSAVN